MALWEGIFVAVLLVGAFAVLLKDWAPPDYVMLFIDVCYIAARIITVKEGTSGFSNSAVLTVAVLFVVAAGLSETGALDYVLSRLLGQPRSLAAAQVRLLVPTMVASAFLNNTPIVAIMVPLVVTWSRKCNISATKLLIPLSFASILGGTVTLIGTSTNLVVAGLASGQGIKFALLDLAPIGLPVAVAGLVYMALFSDRLLPGNALTEADNEHYLYVTQVPNASPLVGKTVTEAGLRGLPEGLFLASVVRHGRAIPAVGPDCVLAGGDRLEFTGMPDRIGDLCARMGLVLVGAEEEERDSMAMIGRRSTTGGVAAVAPMEGAAGRGAGGAGSSGGGAATVGGFGQSGFALVRATVRLGAPVVGGRLKDLSFRSRFGASVVAIRRNGKHVGGKLGLAVLEAGDQLVMNAGPAFDWQDADMQANFVVSEMGHANGSGAEGSADIEKEFMIAMVVQDRSPILGKTVQDAGLRNLPATFLVALERATGQHINAVGPDEVIMKGDVLWFAGDLDGVTGLRKIPGVVPQTDQVDKLKDHRLDRFLVQAVVAAHGGLAGKTVRELQFRTRFSAAIIGVHRQGQRLKMRVGDVELQPGDVLLMEAGPSFMKEHAKSPAFALVSSLEGSAPPRMDKLWIGCLALAGMIALYIPKVLDLFVAATFAAAVMLLARCLSVAEARQAVKWDILVAISAAFGISAALQASGVARAIADVLVKGGKAMKVGGIGVQGALYIATALLSNIIANNAAAALMFPIAVEASRLQAIDLKQTLILIMMGASAAFLSPFGYQTNLMVYGAGGYKFADFLRFGAPLQLLVAVVAILAAALHRFWYLILIASVVLAVVVLGGRSILQAVLRLFRKSQTSVAQDLPIQGATALLPPTESDHDDQSPVNGSTPPSIQMGQQVVRRTGTRDNV